MSMVQKAALGLRKRGPNSDRYAEERPEKEQEDTEQKIINEGIACCPTSSDHLTVAKAFLRVQNMEEEQSFSLRYDPKVTISTRRICGWKLIPNSTALEWPTLTTQWFPDVKE